MLHVGCSILHTRDIVMSQQLFWFALLVTIWSLPWKGYALWRAARLGHRWWFVILLVLNTAAILEIIYIFLVARKYKTGVPETVESEDK